MSIFEFLHSSLKVKPAIFIVLACVFNEAICKTASFPFLETFNSKKIAPYWEKNSTGINSSINDSPFVTMSRFLYSNDSNYVASEENLNELTLSIDLEGEKDVYLSFLFAVLGQNDHPMPETFERSSNSTGLAISTGDELWYRVKDFSGDSINHFSVCMINLDSVMEAYNLNYTSNFKIRFQQYESNIFVDYYNSGLAIDSINIYTPQKNEIRYTVAGNGVIDDGNPTQTGTGIPFTINAKHNAGWGFHRWEIKSGDARLHDQYSRQTSCTIYTDAEIQAVFRQGSTIHAVDTNELVFSRLTHAFAGFRAGEVRFKYANTYDIRKGIFFAGNLPDSSVEIVSYGADSSFQYPVSTAMKSDRYLLHPVDSDYEADTCYFSVIFRNQNNYDEKCKIRLCPIYKVTVDSSEHGTVNHPVLYGRPGDRLEIEAKAFPGYHVTGWEVTDGESVITSTFYSRVYVKLLSDTRIRPIYQRSTIYAIDTGEKEIVLPNTQEHVRFKIAPCDTGEYGVRFELGRSDNAMYNYHGTDTTFTHSVTAYQSDEKVVTIPVHITTPDVSHFMSVQKYASSKPYPLSVSLKRLFRCSTTVAGNGYVIPSSPFGIAPDIVRVVKAYPNDCESVFKHWEVVSGKCMLLNKYDQKLLFYGSEDAVLRAVFQPRKVLSLRKGLNILPFNAPEFSSEIYARFTVPEAGDFLVTTENCSLVNYYKTDSTYAKTANTAQKNLSFSAESLGQNHFFKVVKKRLHDQNDKFSITLSRAVYAIPYDSDSGLSYVSPSFTSQGKEAEFTARAAVDYSFSHWVIDSGDARIHAPSNVKTQVTLTTSAVCRPVFQKTGPLNVRKGIQTFFQTDHFNGRSGESPLRFAFTAPDSGWYSFTINEPSNDSSIRIHSISLGSLPQKSDTSTESYVNQVCFALNEGETSYFELYRKTSTWDDIDSISIGISPFYDLTIEAETGGEIIPSAHHFFGCNDTIFVNAATDINHSFVKWSNLAGENVILDSLDPVCRIHVVSDGRIVARFSSDSVFEIQDTLNIKNLSRDVLCRYRAPNKGEYAFKVESDDTSGILSIEYFCSDSSFTEPVSTGRIYLPTGHMIFSAVVPDQNCFFKIINTNYEAHHDYPITLKVKPVYTCSVIGGEVFHSSPDLPKKIGFKQYNLRRAFSHWAIRKGDGSIDSVTNDRITVRAESDMVIEAVCHPIEDFEIGEQKRFITKRQFRGNYRVTLAYTAPSPGAYSVVLEKGASLRYYGTDSSLHRQEGHAFLRDFNKYAFRAQEAGERHFFDLSNQSFNSENESLFVYVESAWTAAIASNENGSISIDDTVAVAKGDTLKFRVYPKIGYGITDVSVQEGTCSLTNELNEYGAFPQSDVLIKVNFAPAEYSYQKAVVGENVLRFLPMYAIDDRTWRTSRLFFDPPETGLYAIGTPYGYFRNNEVCHYVDDSTFTRAKNTFYFNGDPKFYYIACEKGVRQYFEVNCHTSEYSTFHRLEIHKGYRVSIESNEGGYFKPGNDVLGYGGELKIVEAYPEEGFHFNGWYKITDGDTSFADDNFRHTFRCGSEFTLYASFEKISTGIINKTPKRPSPISKKGTVLVAPNPVKRAEEQCDIYFRTPFEGFAKMTIYDPLGNVVTSSARYVQAVEYMSQAPFYKWNLRNRDGRKVAKGTYLAVVEINGIRTKNYVCKIGIK